MNTSQWRRAVENRCVFNACLKALSDRSGDRSAGGRRFHVAGPLTVKLCCSVAVRARGTSRVPVAADRRCWRPEMAVRVRRGRWDRLERHHEHTSRPSRPSTWRLLWVLFACQSLRHTVNRITVKVISRFHWNWVLWLVLPIGRTDLVVIRPGYRFIDSESLFCSPRHWGIEDFRWLLAFLTRPAADFYDVHWRRQDNESTTFCVYM